MSQPEKLTADIELPNLSHRLDPRLDTVWYRDARRRAAEAKKTPTGRRTGGVRAAVSRARDNFRTFVGGSR